jgi:hypothetical protein
MNLLLLFWKGNSNEFAVIVSKGKLYCYFLTFKSTDNSSTYFLSYDQYSGAIFSYFIHWFPAYVSKIEYWRSFSLVIFLFWTCTLTSTWGFFSFYLMFCFFYNYSSLHAPRIPNCFCGISCWMRLLSHYVILQVAHQHLAVEALLLIGTMHALQQVFFNLHQKCDTCQSSHPLSPTEYMLIPFLVWCSPVNQSSQSAVRDSSKSGPDQVKVKTISHHILENLF